MNDNLFYALCAEHEQRTGHDIFTMSPHSAHRYLCDVCRYLDSYYREIQKAEEEYYEQKHQEYLKAQEESE